MTMFRNREIKSKFGWLQLKNNQIWFFPFRWIKFVLCIFSLLNCEPTKTRYCTLLYTNRCKLTFYLSEKVYWIVNNCDLRFCTFVLGLQNCVTSTWHHWMFLLCLMWTQFYLRWVFTDNREGFLVWQDKPADKFEKKSNGDEWKIVTFVNLQFLMVITNKVIILAHLITFSGLGIIIFGNSLWLQMRWVMTVIILIKNCRNLIFSTLQNSRLKIKTLSMIYPDF